MRPAPARVRSIRRETADTFTLELAASEESGKWRFAPGQFNMLYRFGIGEVPISISGDPAARGRLVHTIRAVGAVTRALQGLEPDDVVGVRGPFGSRWPLEACAGRDVVLVAGGIGLAPLRPVLSHVLAHRPHYGRVALLYGARTPDDILYRDELERWGGRFDLELHVTVDRALPGWRGNVGVVTTLIPKATFEPDRAIAMVCGPEVMMRFAILGLFKRGLAGRQVWLSMERNMKCGLGFCGHCQYGPDFICKDGPVFRFDRVESRFGKREI